MKLFILLILLSGTVFAAEDDYASPNSKRSEELILSADHAVIRDEQAKPDTGIVINDRAWNERMAHALAKTRLVEAAHCFCTGWTTVYFYKDNGVVYSIAAIHGNQLRASSQRAGGDFRVDEARWKAIHDLIIEKQIGKIEPPAPIPNKPPDRVPII